MYSGYGCKNTQNRGIMIGRLIFEIPIYRKSQDDYSKETKSLLDKYLQPDDNNPMTILDKLGEEERENLIERWSLKFYDSYDGKMWMYNDIVGYIGLFAGKNQIKAEYWYVTAERVSRKMKFKEFEYKNKLFEVWITERDTSNEIRQRLISELSKLSSHFRLKKRYLDLEVFENISGSVNWRELTKE